MLLISLTLLYTFFLNHLSLSTTSYNQLTYYAIIYCLFFTCLNISSMRMESLTHPSPYISCGLLNECIDYSENLGKLLCPSLFLWQALSGLYLSWALPVLSSVSPLTLFWGRLIRSSPQAWPHEDPTSGGACRKSYVTNGRGDTLFWSMF